MGLILGVEIIQGTITEMEIEITTIGIEVEIVETIVEIEVEVEIGLIPGKEEETNQDQDQVKDTLTEMKSAVIATDLVMQCITVLNWRTYLKRKGKKIVLHDDDDVQEMAQAMQHLNTKINSLKVSNSTKKLEHSLSIRGNPTIYPKPYPSVSFDLNSVKILDFSQSQPNGTITHNEQIQPLELDEISEVESNSSSESDIDPLTTMYGEMDEDSFH